MAVLTNQQIGRYYEEYRDTEIAFTKDIMHKLGVKEKINI